MADQAAIVQELYNRIGTLPPDKAAIVGELAKRFQIDQTAPLPGVRSSVLDRVGASMDAATGETAMVPTHPYGGASLLNTPAISGTPTGGARDVLQGVAQMSSPHLNDTAGGLHKVISGGMQIASPTLGAAAIAAPVATAAGLLSGEVAGAAGRGVAQMAGASDEVADLAGDVAGLAGGIAGSHGVPAAGRRVARSAADLARNGFLPRSGTSVQQAAADWALAKGAPLDAAAATNNPIVRGAQEIAQTTVGSGTMAQRAIQARNTWYAEQGRKIAGDVYKDPQTPETAGRAIAERSVESIRAANKDANESYSSLRQREQDPANIIRVPTGSKEITTDLVDEAGNKLKGSVPTYEDIPLPVDMRAFKAKLAPELEQIRRQTRLGQSHYAPTQLALEDIVNGPDFAPASVAEKNLGALKRVRRDNTLTGGVTNEAGGLAGSAIPDLQSAIDASVLKHAGRDALDELHAGRGQAADKYAAIALVDQYRAEPVKLYQQLTAARDSSIDLLRQVDNLAPEESAKLGRAWLDGALDHATESGGFAHADKLFSDWQKLGDETKKIIFPNEEHRADLDKYFQSAKDSARVENTSGTARVAHLTSQGALLLTNPAVGATYLVAGNVVSRLLYSPKFVRAAIRGFEVPASNKGQAIAAALKLVQAAGGAAKPVPANADGLSTNAAPAVPTSEGVLTRGATSAPAGEGPTGQSAPVSESNGARAQAGPGAGGFVGSADTTISIPGSTSEGYKAQYKLRELSDVQPSHHGATFQPNPKYQLANDRDYANPVNKDKVITNAGSKFNPALHITDNPDATNGPIVTDSAGNVYGGNGRAMMLQRVYGSNAKGAAAYRELLARKAAQFGLDPAAVARMKQPVLTREIPDSEFLKPGNSKQNAVTDFNKTGTAALTPGERSIADSRRVSPEVLDNIAGRLEEKGADATIAEILKGKPGGELLTKLIADGVIASGERAGLMEKDGELTDAGRDRIERLIVGRFFTDAAQYDAVAPSVRHQVERMAAPLAQVETLPGWNLTPEMRDALTLIEDAQSHGSKNLDDFIAQDGLFGNQKYSERAVTLARALKTLPAAKLKAAARQYASDAAFASKGEAMFGAPTPEQSFTDAFGGTPANTLAK